jgi:hypothetical protein
MLLEHLGRRTFSSAISQGRMVGHMYGYAQFIHAAVPLEASHLLRMVKDTARRA